MARSPGRVAPFALLLFQKFASADYCEFGFCEAEEYCCGDNKCCKKTLDVWFFWAAVLLVLLALIVAAGLRYSRSRPYNYTQLTQKVDDIS